VLISPERSGKRMKRLKKIEQAEKEAFGKAWKAKKKSTQ
jgi:hypothetical protein